MTEWILFNIIRDNMVSEFFGNYVILALVLTLIFLIILIGSGIDFRFAIIFSLPILAGFASIGWFGSNGWVVNLALLMVGIIYGYTLIKLFGGG